MFSHLVERVFNTPLLISRPKLDGIASLLGSRFGLDAQAVPQVATAPSLRTNSADSGGIAVVPIHGALVRRTYGLDALCGLTSYESIDAQITSALADPTVRGLLLDIDSPGGEAGGVFDLADKIAAARATKPIWAVANDSAFSAAYALAAAASRVWITRTGGAGSIGVIALHVDQSARDAAEGYRYTAITAGTHKADGSPHAPLTDDAHATIQAEVDRLYTMFVTSVAAHRGLSVDAVRATEARLYFGPDAVQAGLADQLGTLGDALTALRASLGTPAPPTRLPTSSTRQRMDNPAITPPTLSAEATATTQNVALAIAELCLLAGKPNLTAEFLAKGVTVDAARQALLNSLAAGVEIASHHTSAAPARSASLNENPVVKAARARADAAKVR